MAIFDAFTPPDPDSPRGGKSAPPRAGLTRDPGGVTTYYYRTSGGSRGNTTALGSVPAGAVIEREATT